MPVTLEDTFMYNSFCRKSILPFWTQIFISFHLGHSYGKILWTSSNDKSSLCHSYYQWDQPTCNMWKPVLKPGKGWFYMKNAFLTNMYMKGLSGQAANHMPPILQMNKNVYQLPTCKLMPITKSTQAPKLVSTGNQTYFWSIPLTKQLSIEQHRRKNLCVHYILAVESTDWWTLNTHSK